MIAVSHFDSSDADFSTQAEAVLRMLATKPGYRRGNLARSTDDDAHWLLVTEWDDVGSYRRGFSADVRLVAMPLFAASRDLPSAFESLVEINADGTTSMHESDRA